MPVEREINGEVYNEILLCGSENADLRRLNNNGAVLYNHNRDDLIGAVVSAQMDTDRVGRATLKISTTASDMWEMIQKESSSISVLATTLMIIELRLITSMLRNLKSMKSV